MVKRKRSQTKTECLKEGPQQDKESHEKQAPKLKAREKVFEKHHIAKKPRAKENDVATSSSNHQKKDGLGIQQRREREGAWSKSKKKRMRRLKAKKRRRETEGLSAQPLTTENDENDDNKATVQKVEADKEPNVGTGDEAADLRRAKKKKKKRKKEDKKRTPEKDTTDGHDDEDNGHSRSRQSAEQQSSVSPSSSSSSLQKSFQSRLTGSRFRMLNEELYTTDSAASYRKWSAEPALYRQYHEGFRHQVEQWPVNPVTVIGQKLIRRYRQKHSEETVVVADFGCGDAGLAKLLAGCGKNNNKQGARSIFRVHSFDLVADDDGSDNLVTACDMAHVPLKGGTVDVGVFCLSLMGTNLADFIREAHRVLKNHPDARLWIAEVRSRFESTTTSTAETTTEVPPENATTAKGATTSTHGNNNNKNNKACVDSGLKSFVDALDQLGFSVVDMDKSNPMFVLIQLEKNGKNPDSKLNYTAKPCIYKKR